MNKIENKILLDWMANTPHISTWGRNARDTVWAVHRDCVRIGFSGDRLYQLWGTNMCYMSDKGVFYFYVTNSGNCKSCTCMSQTSKSRINALLPYGCITQKNYHNYFHLPVLLNGKVVRTDTKLELGYWYKLKDGNIVKVKGKPLTLID